MTSETKAGAGAQAYEARALGLRRPPGILPVEQRDSPAGWLARVLRTLGTLIARPGAAFRQCPEPIPHGRVLAFLATLRFPLWVVLVVALGVVRWRFDQWGSPGTKGVHAVLEPALGRALSVWLLLMVPIGMPLLYFVGGLMAHVSIALTGGAARSIGASMRAAGYALGPAMLAIGAVDIPLYFGLLQGEALIALAVGVGLLYLLLAAFALARTHQISPLRGVLVAVIPAALLVGVTLLRGVLEVDTFPLLQAPPEAYFVP